MRRAPQLSRIRWLFVIAVIVTNRVLSRLLADVRSMRRSGAITVYCRAGTLLPHGVAVCH